jgi:hypothetical protein
MIGTAVQADGGGMGAPQPGAASLATQASVMQGEVLRLRGLLPGTTSGTVAIQRKDRLRTWVTVAAGAVTPEGRFAARWKADRSGRLTLRAVPGAQAVPGSGGVKGYTGGSEAPTTIVTVYRPAIATWYGPGLYGRFTACGTRLARNTVGVAHRTLPCGTIVELHLDGTTLRVPVIDRGPYANNADWDLTKPAADALGHTKGVQTIGAVVVWRPPPRPPAPTPR